MMRLGMPLERRYAVKDATPLHLAVLFNHIDSLELLVVHAGELNQLSKV